MKAKLPFTALFFAATARALNMHRRTLQRKLAKPPLRFPGVR